MPKIKYFHQPSTVPTWQADSWWQEERWRQFCLNELVKLFFYAVVYGV